jgi:hypothetical protein
MLSRKLMRKLVKKDSRNQLRHFSDIEISTLITGGGLCFGAIAAYSSLGIWVLKLQFLPLQKQSAETKQSVDEFRKEAKERTDKLGAETKQSFDVLSKEMKESSKEMKERTDKLEMKLDMKFDVLSKEIKESNDKINSRVDSVLLRSLDLQRGAKPASE